VVGSFRWRRTEKIMEEPPWEQGNLSNDFHLHVQPHNQSCWGVLTSPSA